MIIPLNAIEPSTLLNIIESFILREGTDYGDEEASMEEKIAAIKLALQQGKVVLVYSELYETVNIVPAEQFQTGTSAD